MAIRLSYILYSIIRDVPGREFVLPGWIHHQVDLFELAQTGAVGNHAKRNEGGIAGGIGSSFLALTQRCSVPSRLIDLYDLNAGNPADEKSVRFMMIFQAAHGLHRW